MWCYANPCYNASIVHGRSKQHCFFTEPLYKTCMASLACKLQRLGTGSPNGLKYLSAVLLRGNFPVTWFDGSYVMMCHLRYPDNFTYTDCHTDSTNILKPRQNGRHFPDDIFKYIFLNANWSISITISLKIVPHGPINNIPALVQIMAWRRTGVKPLSAPMMVNLLAQICVTRPPWVQGMGEIWAHIVIAWMKILHILLHGLVICKIVIECEKYTCRYYYWKLCRYHYCMDEKHVDIIITKIEKIILKGFFHGSTSIICKLKAGEIATNSSRPIDFI